jgi:rhodanese-related sulfurtransferase
MIRFGSDLRIRPIFPVATRHSTVIKDLFANSRVSLELDKFLTLYPNHKRKNHMKKWIVVALLLMSAVSTTYAQQASAPADAGNGTHAAPTSKAKKLTNAEFDALLAHRGQVLLIDVRRPDEISTIGGFPVYLSIQIADLKNHLSEIPKGKPIVTVSNHAGRAGIAADLLADNGFTVAGAVGAQTYEANGGTLLKVTKPAKVASTAGNQ